MSGFDGVQHKQPTHPAADATSDADWADRAAHPRAWAPARSVRLRDAHTATARGRPAWSASGERIPVTTEKPGTSQVWTWPEGDTRKAGQLPVAAGVGA